MNVATQGRAPGAMAAWTLESRLWLRLAVVSAYYFTQGVPAAMFYLVIPAWLSSTGHSAGEIATVVGATGLPPSIKFLAGFVVDRYPFLAMGRRKPWILFGQALICGTFLSGAVLAGADPSVGLLAALGFCAMSGFAFQDVSVDGMIIDLFSDKERPVASGLTYSSATIGMAAMIFLGGRVIEAHGVTTVFAALAIIPLVTFFVFLPLRERAGERLWPWGPGTAHPLNRAIVAEGWGELLRKTMRMFLSPLTIALFGLLVMRVTAVGIGDTLHPMMATQGAGWPLIRFTDLQTMTTLAGGLMGVLFSAFVIPRIGLRLTNLALLTLNGAVYAVFSAVPALRVDSTALTFFLFSYDMLYVCLTVAIFPICMARCSPQAAATQFAIFMAISNSGRPLGASLAALFGYDGLSTLFAIVAALNAIAFVAFLVLRFPASDETAIPPDLVPVLD